MKEVLEVITRYPGYSTFLVSLVLFSFIFIISKFKIGWKGVKPTFEKRDELELIKQNVELKKKISELEEKLQFSNVPDFIKKTDNGEYIGFIISPKPYITVWVDGNWNSEEHRQIFDRFERLWDDETAILLIGKSPNLPSDPNVFLQYYNNFIVEPTANIVLNLSNPRIGDTYVFVMKPGATPFTITFSNTIKWKGGVAYAANTANAIDIVTLYYDGTNYYGNFGEDYA